MKRIFFLIVLILSCSFQTKADPVEDYWNKIKDMKYEDQEVEVDGKRYKEGSLYQEEEPFLLETKEEAKKRKDHSQKKQEYMSEGSLTPKDYKGLLEN